MRDAESTTQEQPRRRGRPKDPTVAARAKDAALSLYHELGFEALGFDAVARRASVGKAALYSRWDSVEELLIDALADTNSVPTDIDTGDVAEDMRVLARAMWDDYSGPYGSVTVRINLDAAVKDELAEPYQQFVRANRLAARRIVQRGIERGQLPADVDSLTLLNLLLGSVLLNALFGGGRSATPAEVDEVIDRTVGIILRGVSAP
jgi:AcrR family transcriptional regulator